MTASEQLLVLLVFISCGWLVGLALEAFRRLRRRIRRNVFFVYLCEIAFWVTQTGILYYVLWRVHDGVFRVYFLGALFVGYFLYEYYFKRLGQRFVQGVSRIGNLIISCLFMIVYLCIGRPIYLIGRACLFLLFASFRMVKRKFIKNNEENSSQT